MRLPAVSLRTRIVAAIVGVTTTATAVMAYFAYQVQSDDVVWAFTIAAESRMITDTIDMQKEVDRVRPEERANAILHELRLQPAGWLLVTKPPGKPFTTIARAPLELDGHQVVALGPPRMLSTEIPEELLRPVEAEVLSRPFGTISMSTAHTTDPETGRPVLVVSRDFGGTDYFLVELFDLGVLETDLGALRRNLALIALGVSVLGVGVALVIGRRIRRPIKALSVAADELGAGALDTRVPVKGRDEVAALAESFNTMAARLGSSIDELHAKDRQQRRFVADVAHDLRTPLASMIATVDSLDHAEPATRTRAAEILGTQVRRLAKLVEDLLEIARFDAGKADLRVAPVDLADLVADAAEVTGMEAAVRASGDVTVIADPRRVHVVVANLLSNAVQHGAAPVTVTLDGTGTGTGADTGDVVVRVADAGPGVPEDLLPILFDRFTRGDHARQATGGSGLGLAIARENVLAHGGSLAAHNDGGAVFTVRLPRSSGVENA
ncbi:sensor histidine kinase [Amycolatopsis balhimycina DSM 5908]|uniref:Signal transduction histidine-protein kinase/phosphatase MprB n=1 Tax=Amycolatopsis balhimycina DSM 5908 TaxID=1081091 RepID=A0A428WZ35_AMYBA|nr:HAMP domain-containing sensor histidine kinase [Amycolatopsis balhimycina]RSM48319.1 sensor histidine kinase [Amycolatopsis balhimycina DSM 5908]